jgi:hypothetical protein
MEKQRDNADIGSRTRWWSWRENRITVGQEAEDSGNGRAQIMLVLPHESVGSD